MERLKFDRELKRCMRAVDVKVKRAIRNAVKTVDGKKIKRR